MPVDIDDFQKNISVVVLNYNRVESTIKSVECAEGSIGGYVREILVVDNGSSPEVVSALNKALSGHARLITVGTNRYFGEGNNIGVEEATGEYILLLNNDAYVEPDCIQELVETMRRDSTIAAVGPMFLYPDGSVQEVGGIVLETGDIVQVGKGAIWAADHYVEPCRVDYCSAACLLMRRKDFLTIKGFGLQWEPAYYEDVDLCLTLWDRFGPVIVNPRARVVHLESLTTGDARMRLESQVEINRLTFVEKWGEWLTERRAFRPSAHVGDSTGRVDSRLPQLQQSRVARTRPKVVLYSPYELTPGGGERVLFELAATLAERFGDESVRMASPHRYSSLRIRQLSEVFGLVEPTLPATLEDLREMRPEICVVLGNEAVPPIPGYGSRYNVYLCQFPFDAPEAYLQSNAPYVASFDEIWVYSDFVRRYVNGHLRLLGLTPPQIRVMYPPATLPQSDDLPDWRERNAIITVGRFFKGGHDKRQDVVIDIAKQVSQKLGRPVPLWIAGSLHANPMSRDRFREIATLAEESNCRLFPNISRAHLIHLYKNAAVLVHAAGYGVDKLAFPERLEHFGIVPIEAASLGCIPVVFGAGGPAEVMRELQVSNTFTTTPEAVEKIAELLSDPEKSEKMSNDLRSRSAQFSTEAFRTRVMAALADAI